MTLMATIFLKLMKSVKSMHPILVRKIRYHSNLLYRLFIMTKSFVVGGNCNETDDGDICKEDACSEAYPSDSGA